MRRLLALSAIMAFSSACAVTDYPVITDQDQVRQANGTHIVNTTGRAFIMQKVQVASFIGDTSFNAVWFVNQDQRGNQTLYTHMNIGLVANPDTWFHGNIYLNDNRNTCWNIRAANPNSPSDTPFDFDINVNCKGTEALAVLISKGSRTTESGGDGNNGNDDSPGSDFGGRGQAMAGVTLQQAIGVLSQLDSYATYGKYPEYGLNGYKMTLTPANVDIQLANPSGVRTDFNLDGVTVVYDVVNERAVFDTRGSNAKTILRELADWVDANGREGTVSVTFAGTTATNPVALFSASQYRKLADRL